MEKILKDDIRYLKGVGPVRSAYLSKIGISTVDDLLRYAPLRYEDRTSVLLLKDVEDKQEALVKCLVTAVDEYRPSRRRSLLKIRIEDSTQKADIYAFNQSFLKNIIKAGNNYYFYAKFLKQGKYLRANSFEYEEIKTSVKEQKFINLGRIIPVYPLTQGLSQKWLRNLVYNSLKEYMSEYKEFLPLWLLKQNKLIGIKKAVRYLHFPPEMSTALAARKRLVFEEFFLFQLALSIKKLEIGHITKERRYEVRKKILTSFREKLEFEFTGDQKKAINEIFNDLLSYSPMKRLLQGEVGSGKTVVAMAALLLAVENDYQGIIIAPTEILAEQHYLTFKNYVGDLGVKLDILTGSTKKTQRKRIVSDLRRGKTDILVGTHALLSPDVDISGASLIVIDEQHKFGVMQKARLIAKSRMMDVLSMSATPIPRSLAMSLYGDLDISTIRELPKDRKKPETMHLADNDAYTFALKELKASNLVYIVHPVIEDSEENDIKSAENRFSYLKNSVFRNYNCDLLHGRMKAVEKDRIMHSFSRGETQVLFTTTVVEVGINIERANVMIIEDYFRFGLASLHQLRGRIARSTLQPYCILTGRATTEESKKRLQIILNSSDGFKIAEEDLLLRGGGELFGQRQHGMVDFKIGDPVADVSIMAAARNSASEILSDKRSIYSDSNKDIRDKLMAEYGDKFHLAAIS